MEMDKITKEKESNPGDEGPSGQVLMTKTEEEAEQDIYSKLENPTEDIYVEAGNPLKQRSGNQTQGNVRLYRAVCVLLSIICLVLLLVSIVLSMKLTADDGVICSLEKCQARFTETRSEVLGCHLCAEGWVAYGNSCFYLSRHKLSWDESHRNCTARGGDLAVISNRNIQNFLSEKGNVMYWIGLKYRGNQWTWVNNTALVDSYWGGGRKGDCALLSGGQPYQDNWVQEACTSQTYYICQLQP